MIFPFANPLSWSPALTRFAAPAPDAVPIWFVAPGEWDTIKASIGRPAAAFAERCGFKPKPGQTSASARRGRPSCGRAVWRRGCGRSRIRWPRESSPTSLPEGVYRFANPPAGAELAALGFLMALYRYDRFKANKNEKPRLVAPEGVDAGRIERIAEAVAFGRDLVNAPANVARPRRARGAAVKLADGFGAASAWSRGEELVAANFPLVHAVGRAAAEPPRIVDFVWGRRDAPKVTLVGKGVTFDSGGLDIKPASGMELMKKDMGGAATALTLARLVMESGSTCGSG